MSGRYSGYSGYNFKRIYIEKALSVKLHSTENSVIECGFHYIGIFAYKLIFKHCVCKEHKADRSTGFCIGGIGRKVIINAERFSDDGRAYTACNVHSSACDAFPQPFASVIQGVIAAFCGKLCHTGIKIYRSYCVTRSVALRSYGLAALLLVVRRRIVSPH